MQTFKLLWRIFSIIFLVDYYNNGIPGLALIWTFSVSALFIFLDNLENFVLGHAFLVLHFLFQKIILVSFPDCRGRTSLLEIFLK